MATIRAEIAAILKIEDNDGWEIRSSVPEKNLYLVHYTDKADLNRLGDLRGVVVDTQARTVVCRSFGYTPVARVESIALASDQKYHFTDTTGQERIFDPATTVMKIGFDGTLLRIFYHDGEVYFSTHTRLQLSPKSRWGTSIPFLEMYAQLGGPQGGDLFDLTKQYSPYCHLILMVHPEVAVATRQNLGPGYLVYLGPKKMYDADVYPPEQVDDTLRVVETVREIPEVITKPFIYYPGELQEDAANSHLRFGYYQPFDDSQMDRRMRPGEFVVLQQVENNQVGSVLKVESLSYAWRSSMIDNNPNLYHRFFQLLNGSYIKNFDSFNDRFPHMAYLPMREVKALINQFGFVVSWPTMTPYGVTSLTTQDDRLYNIFLAYLYAVPLHFQCSVVEMYNSLLSDRKKLVGWLGRLEKTWDTTVISQEITLKQVPRILNQSRKFAQLKLNSPENTKPLSQLIRESISYLIYNEEGGSLYQMIKYQQNYQAEKNTCPAT